MKPGAICGTASFHIVRHTPGWAVSSVVLAWKFRKPEICLGPANKHENNCHTKRCLGLVSVLKQKLVREEAIFTTGPQPISRYSGFIVENIRVTF